MSRFLFFIDLVSAIGALNPTQESKSNHKNPVLPLCSRFVQVLFSRLFRGFSSNFVRSVSTFFNRFSRASSALKAEIFTASSRLYMLIEPTDNRQESLPQKRITSNTPSPVTLISLCVRPFSVSSPRFWFQVFSGGRFCRERP